MKQFKKVILSLALIAASSLAMVNTASAADSHHGYGHHARAHVTVHGSHYLSHRLRHRVRHGVRHVRVRHHVSHYNRHGHIYRSH